MSQPPSLPPKPQSSIPAQPLPKEFQAIPTSELERLSSSITELKGYLLTQSQSQSAEIVTELDSVIAQMRKYVTQLSTLDSSKEKTNIELNQIKQLQSQWEAIRNELLETRDAKFSSTTLSQSLLSLIDESRTTSESLVDCFIQGGLKTEEDLEQFIVSYRKERVKFHLRGAKLQRLKEDRVAGLFY